MSEMQKLAAPCRRIPLSVNSSTQRPVMPDEPETELRSGELPALVLGESVVFCLTFLNPDGSAVIFSGDEVFELSGDCDYDHETGLMFYAGPDRMNLPGDWAEADPAKGKIALRVSCNTENFASKLGDQEEIPVFLEVRMTAADAVTRSILLRTTATALNTIRHEGEPPEEIQAEFYTAAQTEARLNSKAEAEHAHDSSQIVDLAGVIGEQIAPVEQALTGKINEKADTNHTHEEYADSTHIHEQYIQAEFVENRVTAAMPAGTVIAYAGSSAPEGFIACNGAAVSRETYANLFAAIGTIYGAGDGSTTFNLPDLTDRVVQGSATAGTALTAGLPEISAMFVPIPLKNSSSGNVCSPIVSYSGALTMAKELDRDLTGFPITSALYQSALYRYSFNASSSNSIYGNSTTVQPPALTMIYCIKY